MTSAKDFRYVLRDSGRPNPLNPQHIAPWQVEESSLAFDSPWLRVRKDRVRTNRGNLTDYYVVERFDYTIVVPVTDDGQVVTVRQYKHGAGEVVRELPAGYIEDGEDALPCAFRELREETGYTAKRMEPLAVLFASPSASGHRAHIFLATGVSRIGGQALDANEKIAVEPMPFAQAINLAAANADFRDLGSTAALFLAWQRWTAADRP
jgi:ADP-ribose pyrophosphatase